MGLWKFVVLEGSRIPIPEADTYILGAWSPAYSHFLNLGSRTGVLITSSAGEMDLEPVEQEYLRSILVDPRVNFVWFGSKSLADVYPEKGFYAPYPISTGGELLQTQKQDIMTLFCSTGLKKNILNQLLAVQIAQRHSPLVLHTNIQGYDEVLAKIKHVRHGWLDRDVYAGLLASARMNLAVSWAETYCYQVAECALLGTPSIISSTVPLPGHVVQGPNDPREIGAKILWMMDRAGLREPAAVRHEMVLFAQGQNAICRYTLKERLGIRENETSASTP